MYLWKWLIDFRWKYHGLRWFNLIHKSRNVYLIYLLMGNDRLLNVFYQEDLEKALRELIREAEHTAQESLIKYIAYTLLGKINFEKGLMPIAYNHFKEALECFRKSNLNDLEEEARLKAWLGLISLKLGEFKEAVDLLKDAIDIINDLFGRGELLGELKVLLADALYFVDSNEAVQVAEDAHEILKKFITPLYLSNAIKLTAALAARRYNVEAVSILREGFDRYGKLIYTFNIGFIKTIKAIENNSKKMIFYINELPDKAIVDFIIGLEGLKGAYYVYRRTTNLSIPTSKLLNVNKSIVRALLKGKNPEDMINSKKRHMEILEDKVVFGRKLRPTYTIESMLDSLQSTFNNVAILSFIEGDESQIYRVSYIEKPRDIAKTKVIEIGDDVLESQDLPLEEASIVVERSLPNDFLENIAYLGEEDLLIISTNGKLTSVPWDLLPVYTNNDVKYLGLTTNIVYVPTLYEIKFWEKKRTRKFERSYYISPGKLDKKRREELGLLIYECGYTPITNINNLIDRRNLEIDIDILILCDRGIESIDDDIYFKFGKNYLSMMDLEKIVFKGDLAVVCTESSLQSISDETGIHNPTFSFLMSGYKAVIGHIGSEVKLDNFTEFLSTLFKDESEPIYKKVFNTKKQLHEKGIDWWRFQLYGNPFVRIL